MYILWVKRPVLDSQLPSKVNFTLSLDWLLKKDLTVFSSGLVFGGFYGVSSLQVI